MSRTLNPFARRIARRVMNEQLDNGAHEEDARAVAVSLLMSTLNMSRVEATACME